MGHLNTNYIIFRNVENFKKELIFLNENTEFD